MPSLSLCHPDDIDIEANALQIMATSVMVAVSDALDDFMSSLEKFRDVIKLEFMVPKFIFEVLNTVTVFVLERLKCKQSEKS